MDNRGTAGGMQADSAPAGAGDAPGPLRRWWRSRRRYRARVRAAADDLVERYRPVAARLAESSARRALGPDERAFWRDVAVEISRRRGLAGGAAGEAV